MQLNLSESTTYPPAIAGGTDTTDNAALAQLQAENEQLKATIRFDAAHRQITGELERAGARSPELLFDSVKGDLQFADVRGRYPCAGSDSLCDFAFACPIIWRIAAVDPGARFSRQASSRLQVSSIFVLSAASRPLAN